MRCSVAALIFLSACSFSGSNGNPLGPDDGGLDAPPADAPPDSKPPPPPPPPPCKAGFVDLCLETPRTDALSVTGNVEINSGTDARCVVRQQTGGPDLCILYFTSIDIPSGGNLLIHGSRAVVLASTTTISIVGNLDVSSRRNRLTKNGAGNGTCTFTTNPENDGGGGGGGAGGTFAIQGSRGATGDLNDSNGQGGNAPGGTPGTAIALPTVLRGGCVGQKGGAAVGNGGDGGPSGGALFLFAKGAITISGKVLASGAGGEGGGNRAGGGGGGSGGFIVIESELQSAISGLVLATGGGGGEGGTLGGASDGNSGSDPDSANAAPGGTGRDGGDGGSGATYLNTATVPPGTPVNDNGGGGGGGGGNGFILLRGAGRAVTGTVAPAPIQPAS